MEQTIEPNVLTFLIADVRGYTRFTRERGDAAAAMLAQRFADLARDAVAARNGSVLELRGDEALAVFGSPAQAVRAALELQTTCGEESEADPAFPLPIGIGIDVGEAVPVEDGYRGVALNMAARLCASAGAGQVLVTRSIVGAASELDGEIWFEERGPASFKGFDETVDVIQPVAPDERPIDRPAALETRLPPELDPLTPLVDRERELRWLRGTWRVARRGHGRILIVSGPAQIGKTRLAAEMAAHVSGDGAAVRYAGPGGAAAAVALSALRDTLRASGPTLLILDDVDVSGPAVADAISSALDELRAAPVLLLALLRDSAASAELASVIDVIDERGDGHRVLDALNLDGVRGIVELYVGGSASDVPVEAMARASKGIPGRVHEVVSDWARSEATRRLAAAAEFLAEGRERHASDLAFANNVIGLKLGRLYTVEGRDVLATEACPYKGLAAFAEDDSGLFFGRERLVGELAARTVQSPLLGVIGASGSGKSSVVGAGLLPSLRAGLLPGSEQWIQATMRPGEHPMQELRRALGTDAENPLDAAIAAIPVDGRLVLVVDQFEETFTTCTSEEDRVEFIDELTGAAKRWSERVAIVVAIRGDYYANSAPYPELAERLAANHVLVGPLTREELRRAIELPARRAGLRLESPLVDALVEEVADEPGALPLLSTALVELWQHREVGWIRLDAYERTGGVRGAVARLAESSYEQLSDAERDATRPIFLRLVAVGEGEAVTKRSVGLDEFDLDRDHIAAALLTKLTQDRLLTMTEHTVEVAHEALLREWPRLREWLEEDAQGRQLRQHLTQVARQWEASREPSELYRGARLSAALDWFAGHAGDLNEREREFLTASRQTGEQEAQRQRRTNRRLRGLLVGTAVFLVVAVAAGLLALVQRGSARRSAGEAEHSATVALAQSLGAQSLVAKSPDLSLLLAAQSVALDDDRKTESTLLAALLRWQGVLRVFHPNENRLLRIAVSPDGALLAISDNSSHVYVYDTATLEQRFALARFADGVIFSTDGRTLFVASGPRPGDPEEIEAFDASTGEWRWGVATGISGVTGFALSPDGRLLAHADDPFVDTPTGSRPSGEPHTLTVLNAADGSPAGPPITLGMFSGATFAGSHRILSSNGNVVEIVDLRTRRVIRTFEVAEPIRPDASTLAASPDGVAVAIALSDGSIQLIDLAGGRRRILSAPSSFEIFVLRFSPDGRTLGASGANGAVVTWDVGSGSARTWHGQTGSVTALSFTADGRTMWTDGLDGAAVEWDLAGDRSFRQQFDARFPEEPNSLPFISFTPDGRQIVVTGSDQRTRFFDATTLEPTGALPKDSVECCMPPAFSNDGDFLATVDGMGVDLWDPAERSLIRRLYTSEAERDSNAPAPVDAVAISPDGSVVAANDNHTVLLLDTRTGTIERRLDAGWYIAALTFSADGDLLAADGGVPDGPQYSAVWDARTGEQLWQHEVPMQSSLVSFSADGKLFAVGNADGLVFVFDARSGQVVGAPFVGDAGYVFSIGFHPRSGIVAVTGTDGVVTLADPVTGATFGSPLVSPSEAWSTGAWSPDGSRYVLIGGNGIGNLWDMSPRDWARRACRTAGRSLTRREWRQFLPDRPYDPAC